MMQSLVSVPPELKAYPQWVVWRAEKRGGKLTKVPYSPVTGRRAKTDTPATWCAFSQALAYCQHGFDGLGYVFSADDGLAGIDLDKCANNDGGFEPWALDIVRSLASYTERSPSGRGLHVIVRVTLPPSGRRKERIEMYDSLRYFTMTGDLWRGAPSTIQSRQAEVEALHASVFASSNEAGVKRVRGPFVPVEDDEALILRAQNARNGAKFSALWHGDSSGYPSQSEADLALCNILAFWTGEDATRVDRFFRQSVLYRPKWDERHYADGRTYGQATVAKACR